MKTINRAIVGTIAFLTFAGFQGEAQTNIIIKSPLVADDHTMKISWNAEPGAVYQVESADSLTDIGNQGLQWVIRESDCPSRGTNAEWMDVGDSQWIPRIFPPRFQPMRFYRITKVKQATLTPAPAVTLQLDKSNLVSGFIYATVNVTYADTNQQMSSVGIYVDGQQIYTTTDDSSSTYINSSEWPIGAHEIYAVVTTVDSGETLPDSDAATETNAANFVIAISPSQFVTFSNYISEFFVSTPFFDPAVGQAQEVVATLPEDSCWRLTVLDYQYNPVRQYTGQSSSLYAAWDGNDANGNPTPYGFYDYYIEARPSRFGCLSGMSSMSSMSVSSSAMTAISGTPSASAQQLPARIQFNKLGGIDENLIIPSLNPAPPADQTMLAASLSTALAERTITYDGTNEFINGVPAFLYPPMPDENTAPRLARKSMIAGAQPMDGGSGSGSSYDDGVYTTDYPNRAPGNMFKGYAGVVGVGSQGHHPHSPSFGLPPGGITSPSHPPYGKLVNASVIANGFSKEMVKYGWRTGFNLQDDNLNSTNLFPVMGAGSGDGTFAKYCHFGLLIGHMTSTAYTDPDYYVTHSYYPVYNTQQPGSYQWIPLPGMDFGNNNGSSPLKWMALYGCNSLLQVDEDDMWTHFELPFPPNLRLLLGSEEGIFINPAFGQRLARNLNNSMTIFQAWCEAAGYVDEKQSHSWKYGFIGIGFGTRHMTCVYRDDSQEGSWRTISDSIWDWSSDISYDWYDVSFYSQQVYP
jgi:hypothetical protein